MRFLPLSQQVFEVLDSDRSCFPRVLFQLFFNFCKVVAPVLADPNTRDDSSIRIFSQRARRYGQKLSSFCCVDVALQAASVADLVISGIPWRLI